MENKERKIGFIVVFFFMLFLWMLLTGFTYEEIIAGSIASLITAAMSYRLFTWEKSYPRRLLWLLAYIPYYIYAEIMAHLEVIYLILTGKINPGIVEIDNPHSSDFGTTALANSITMTPGTLTLETKPGKLYIHWLNMKKDKKAIASGFERFLRMVWQ
ncbi:MAG: Na+/H+ antiporter subunit E [Candidatus Aenigmarchaeota archaeon]|nr:Na+/H+ antiporter subunit E [Candidatus Aenigmarchaeota archaeon]